MKLLFKQKFSPIFNKYDIFFEDKSIAFHVEGKFSISGRLDIETPNGEKLGMIKRKHFTPFHTYKMYVGKDNEKIGKIRKQFSILKPKFIVKFYDKIWKIKGNFVAWTYEVKQDELVIAKAHKEVINLFDTYVMDIPEPKDSLFVLMLVLAIDSIKAKERNN